MMSSRTGVLRFSGTDRGSACFSSPGIRATRPRQPRRALLPSDGTGVTQASLLGSVKVAVRRGMMKYLLTSAGIKNASIHAALVELLGKPIAECDALCIPTAGYGHPQTNPGKAWKFI